MAAALEGHHLTVDGLGRRPQLWSPEGVERLLLELVQVAAMNLIAGPEVRTSGDNICGIAILAESHTSAHLDTSSGAAHVDLFSCKGYDVQHVKALVVDRLDLQHYRTNFQRRDAQEVKA